MAAAAAAGTRAEGALEWRHLEECAVENCSGRGALGSSKRCFGCSILVGGHFA